MNKLRRIAVFLLIVCLGFCFIGCGPTPEPAPEPEPPEILAMPANVRIIDLGNNKGRVTWDMVKHAESYLVTINGVEHETANTYYAIEPMTVDYTATVVARADGYTDSNPSEPATFSRNKLQLAINGKSEIRSGGTLQLTANIDGEASDDVTWRVMDGREFASVSSSGLVTAQTVSGDKLVTVKATSVADPTVTATKVLTVTARPAALTDAMLAAISASTASFEGYIVIDFYDHGKAERKTTTITDVYTAMDGTHWYTEYENSNGGMSGIYCEDHGSYADTVTINFNNVIDYAPNYKSDGTRLTWVDAKMVNNMSSFTAADFTFNEDTWRYEYNGATMDLPHDVTSSVLPYTFMPADFSLIIDGGEIVGIHSLSERDEKTYESQGYDAIREITLAINVGAAVGDVPIVTQYTYDAAKHDKLDAAISRMKTLPNYTLEMIDIGITDSGNNGMVDGLIETIDTDVYHFRQYLFEPSQSGRVTIGNGTRHFTGKDYGFVKRRADLYNTYKVEDGTYTAERAYTGDITSARPSFDFNAAIFTSFSTDPEAGTTTYYVDPKMVQVATTFYKNVNIDMVLYGMFASVGKDSQTGMTAPYVVVDNNGYITDSGFYYAVGDEYSLIEISYYGFGTTSTDTEVKDKLDALATRELPTAWSQLTVYNTYTDEVAANAKQADTYMNSLLLSTASTTLPFFGSVLGDSYVRGLTITRTVDRKRLTTIELDYLVPIELDFSITKWVDAAEKLLKDNGFTKTGTYYVKNGLAVQPVDDSLDLKIYVWKAA